jgi:hypothetical protein
MCFFIFTPQLKCVIIPSGAICLLLLVAMGRVVCALLCQALCPELIIVNDRMSVYQHLSQQISAILQR